MLAILSSQVAFTAATTLAKKSFEFGITTSLRGLSDVIKERFQHSKALQETQAELELKVGAGGAHGRGVLRAAAGAAGACCAAPRLARELDPALLACPASRSRCSASRWIFWLTT